MKRLTIAIIAVIICIILAIPTQATQRIKYTGIARSTGGAVLASATVTIYLAGTTTPASVYEASSGGASVASVTTDTYGRWTFYADVADYPFTQQYKVVATKDGYDTITLDNIFLLALPTNAAGYLSNDGSGNYSWEATTITATTFVGALTGNASTATALAADPTACASGVVTDIAADGTLTCDDSVEAISFRSTGGNVYSGVADTQRGLIIAYGHETGTDEGGTILLYTSADHDGTINEYGIEVYQDDLYIGPDTNIDFIKIVAGTSLEIEGGTTLSKVNAAGGSATPLTLSGTLGIMDGSDTFRGIYLNYTNVDHTGSGNNIYGIYLNSIVSDAEASQYGIFVDSGWNHGIYSKSLISALGDGSTTKGVYRLYDLDNSAYVAITPADETTSYTLTLPAASPTGLLRADAGVMSASDTISSTAVSGGTASTPACWDGSQVLTSCTTQPMIGAVPTTTDNNGMSQAEMTSAGMYGRFYFATGAGTWNLPGAAAGMNICVYSTTAAAVVVNPDDADDITLNGALLADGAAITSASGAGDFICLIAADATHWYTLGRSGTWTGP